MRLLCVERRATADRGRALSISVQSSTSTSSSVYWRTSSTKSMTGSEWRARHEPLAPPRVSRLTTAMLGFIAEPLAGSLVWRQFVAITTWSITDWLPPCRRHARWEVAVACLQSRLYHSYINKHYIIETTTTTAAAADAAAAVVLPASPRSAASSFLTNTSVD